ncbi:FAD-dependent oxidoreductase [Novipirellula herctigrandis]|uniref:FAD-dependent oxidoreductase n=1 Tax=Novipirellula herctigrandis TaxID=2527986 RepID=UPI003AF382D9
MLSYGGEPQDVHGEWLVSEDAKSLNLSGNVWKAIPLTYNITPDTVLEFDFQGNSQGDLHGVGVDTDLELDRTDHWFALYGTQANFGNRDFKNYSGEGTQRFVIPIGQYVQGFQHYLTFGNDHDVGDPTAESLFSNVRVYERGIPLGDYPVFPYGSAKQDVNGDYTIDDTSRSIHMIGNTWKAIPYNYIVTPETVIEFDFAAPTEGDLHGIGIDTDLQLSRTDHWFTLFGTQANFGNRDFNLYGGEGSQNIVVPIGEYYQGQMNYLTFGNDHDVTEPNAESVFSNIRVYERGLNFDHHDVLPYGIPNQDISGDYAIFDESRSIELSGNTWKAIPHDYVVTRDTVIEFDFDAPTEGELQGIGIDTDLQLSNTDLWFKLAGTQKIFGNRDFEHHGGNGSEHFVIPIGEYFEGPIAYLTFGNDHDVISPTAISRFSNLKVYELTDTHRQRQFGYDIVIYGGTPAGVVAAVQAARLGRSVVLVAPSGHVGGMTSSGLGAVDTGKRETIGGIAREFFQRVKTYYDDPASWVFEQFEDYEHYTAEDDVMWKLEPHIAAQVFDDMLDEHFVPTIFKECLERGSGVTIANGGIRSITMESGQTFSGHAFIDATYEGDLMASAGTSYTVGREGVEVYGESLAGAQVRAVPSSVQSTFPVDPFVTPGDSASGLLPGVHLSSVPTEGQGDHRIQAYNFRLTLTDNPENAVPVVKPANYDETLYELLFRYYEAGNTEIPISFHPLPNGKTDSNSFSVFSTDFVGRNNDYPEANYQQREQIVQAHLDYQQGLLWTLTHHPRIPQSIRDEMAKWGLAADEFSDNNYWPYQLYVREARRMTSDYVMTQFDIGRVRVASDSIGLGSYPADSHVTQRFVDQNGNVQSEGGFYMPLGGAFAISYRSIIPSDDEANNLLVPVAISASHVAFGAIRMEPVFMIMGQSAATAAVHAIDSKIAVQDIDYHLLRAQLIADGQRLDIPSDLLPRSVILSSDFDGVTIDDTQAQFDGTAQWSVGSWPFVDYGYHHDLNTDKGDWAATYNASLETGQYEVRLYFPATRNRASNVPVTIVHADGTTQVIVNQRVTTSTGYVTLGAFEFNSDLAASVIISNFGTDGYVIADAVQFLLVC